MYMNNNVNWRLLHIRVNEVTCCLWYLREPLHLDPHRPLSAIALSLLWYCTCYSTFSSSDELSSDQIRLLVTPLSLFGFYIITLVISTPCITSWNPRRFPETSSWKSSRPWTLDFIHCPNHIRSGESRWQTISRMIDPKVRHEELSLIWTGD